MASEGTVNPENRKSVERKPDGTVATGGGSLNPGGRPKGYAEFREKCRTHSDEAISTLVSALTDEKLRVQAASVLLAYGWGKPTSAPEDLEALVKSRPLAAFADEDVTTLAAKEIKTP